MPLPLEDRREARRKGATRALFLVGVLTWTSVAAWWAVYFHRSNVALREARLEALAAAQRLTARDLAHGVIHPLPEGITVASLPIDADASAYPSLEVPMKGEVRALVVAPAERRRIEEQSRRRVIMLAGEGSLMFALLFVIQLVMYRLLLGERRLARQRDAFVHAVTHELKSPIAGLRALLQSIEAMEMAREERAAFVQMGLTELTRLDGLVANILLSTRLEGRDFAPRVVEMDPSSSIARLVERHGPRFVERGGSLSVNAASTKARFDPEAFDTILENLLDNALKYGGDKPTADVRLTPRDGRVEVSIKDGGIGLDPEARAHVFDRFYRAPDGERAHAKGTGLGLFIARGLARACGGELDVQSAGPGRGATFTLSLPV